LLALLLISACATGCGYHTAGKAAALPPDLHTISIPAFKNQTQTYRIEQVLTAAVVREFTSRTHYRVVNQESGDSDATLRGTVVLTQLTPLTYDSQTGRASSGMVSVNMRVTLVDRHGQVLFENPNYQFREQYQISREVSSFFEEESPAIDRLSQDFARTLVSNIVEAF
jgi:outer membrane lipopolysaccharide assembly protein LptE/RlpB